MKKMRLMAVLAMSLSAFAAVAHEVQGELQEGRKAEEDHGIREERPDSLYGERRDSLDAAVFVAGRRGTYLSGTTPIRTEVISSSGLRKMACCNLAESFENSASVTVGYSDAVTGARQIRLLGLSGAYTQMLDENRPAMRGLAAPFGLSQVPGQWLESIQIAKGASSVINGAESVTGQINLEYRKPTDEKPLFLNASVMSDTKIDFNVASSLQMGSSWSTVLLGHVSGNVRSFDHNHDGFMDDPRMLQLNLANRWLYYSPSGVQVRFGLKAVQDSRSGGQEGYDRDTYKEWEGVYSDDPWGSDVIVRTVGGYVKAGFPLREDNSANIAIVADYSYTDLDSWFGATSWLGDQHSLFLNLMYQNEISEAHSVTAGLSGSRDMYHGSIDRLVRSSDSIDPETGLMQSHYVNFLTVTPLVLGVYGEYTYRAGEKLTAVAGLRGDWYSGDGFKVIPRVTFKYSPVEQIDLRLNAGRGLRYANPLADNIGVFSTGKVFRGDFEEFLLEDAWTFGGSFTFHLPFGASDDAYVSVDYFRTTFSQQMIADYECAFNSITFYALDGKRSYSDNFQIDFSVEPFRRFTLNATFRYTDSRVELEGQGLVERPMTSRYKGVLNLQYATRLDKWIFDFTASVNGPCRVYDFMLSHRDASGNLLYSNGCTPVYPLLYLQVTKRFRGVDVYIGGENLTGFRQKDLLLGGRDAATGLVSPHQPSFDASAVWGPVMGARFYAGVRFTLWKTG